MAARECDSGGRDGDNRPCGGGGHHAPEDLGSTEARIFRGGNLG